jgi:hypothetical protein
MNSARVKYLSLGMAAELVASIPRISVLLKKKKHGYLMAFLVKLDTSHII